MSTAEATAERTGQSALVAAVKDRVQQLLAFASLIVIFAFFSIANEGFATWSNITNVLYSTVVIGSLALGTTFVIISAGIDLSIGTGMTLCAVMSGVFIVNWGLSVPVGIACAILFGGLIGFVNGFNVAVLRIPPFIATLAMMMVAQGLALVLSDSTPIYFSEAPSYVQISIGQLIPGLPNAVLVLLVVTVISVIVLNKTLLGRYAYSIGSNEDATALSGVNVRRWKLAIYTMAGLFIGVAGVMISARLASAQPATGMGYELQAIAAVVIGGTSLTGGKGSIVGTLIGALIMSVLEKGLQIMAIPQEWQSVVIGVAILVAVYADMVRKRET